MSVAVDKEGAREQAGDAAASPLYAAAPAASPPLRVGLLFKAGGLPAACRGPAAGSRGLRGGDDCLPCGLYGPRFGIAETKPRSWPSMSALTAAWPARHRPAQQCAADPQSHFPDARQLSCQAAPAGDAGWAIAPGAAGELRDLNLDVILALDRSDWSGEVLSFAAPRFLALSLERPWRRESRQRAVRRAASRTATHPLPARSPARGKDSGDRAKWMWRVTRDPSASPATNAMTALPSWHPAPCAGCARECRSP